MLHISVYKATSAPDKCMINHCRKCRTVALSHFHLTARWPSSFKTVDNFSSKTCHLSLNGHWLGTLISTGWQNTCPRINIYLSLYIYICIHTRIHSRVYPKTPLRAFERSIVGDVLSQNNGHADKKLWNMDAVWSVGVECFPPIFCPIMLSPVSEFVGLIYESWVA